MILISRLVSYHNNHANHLTRLLLLVTVLLVLIAPPTAAQSNIVDVQEAITKAQDRLFEERSQDGKWAGKIYLGAQATAYYVLTTRYVDQVDPVREEKAVKWLLDHQKPDGSWGQFMDGGPSDISISGVATLALEVAQVPSDNRQLVKAKDFVETHGGVQAMDLFAKAFYALNDRFSWDDSAFKPFIIETLLIPIQAKEGLGSMPPWWREGYVPLATLVALHSENGVSPASSTAMSEAESWILLHQLSDGSWFTGVPTFFNIMALHDMDPERFSAQIDAALAFLHRFQDSDGYQRRFELSVWDTALSLLAFRASGISVCDPRLSPSTVWLVKAQSPGGVGLSTAPAGGWSYTEHNLIYPDNDDTALAVSALSQMVMPSAPLEYEKRVALERARRWLLYMQDADGGWSAFLKNEDKRDPRKLPIALEDPSVPDVTGHVLSALGTLGYTANDPSVQRAIAYLQEAQNDNGAWYGRWGLSYLYGTSAALVGLRDVKADLTQPYVQKAVSWLRRQQNEDGGWGEAFESWDAELGLSYTGHAGSTAEQTAWVVMALLAVGIPVEDTAISQGVDYLLQTQHDDGRWHTTQYTVLGLNPYLNSLYDLHWPLMALGAVEQRKRGENASSGQLMSQCSTLVDAYKALPSPDISFDEKLVEIPAVTVSAMPSWDQQSLSSAQVTVQNNSEVAISGLKLSIDHPQQKALFVTSLSSLLPNESHTWDVSLSSIEPTAVLTANLEYLDAFGRTITDRAKLALARASSVEKHGGSLNWLWYVVPVVLAAAALGLVVRRRPGSMALLKFASQNLGRNRLRTGLTILGMVVGISAIAGTWTLGLAFRQKLVGDFANFGTGRIAVLPYTLNVNFGPPKSEVSRKPAARFKDDDVELLKTISNVHAASPYINASLAATYAGETLDLFAVFVDPDSFRETTPLKLATGRFLSDQDDHSINIGYAAANDAFSQRIPVGADLKIGGYQYKVVGVMQEIGGSRGQLETLTSPDVLIYLPLKAASEFTSQEYYDEIEVRVVDETIIDKTSQAVEEALAKVHTGEEFDVVYAQKLQKKVEVLLNQFTIIIAVIGAFALLVSGIGIMNMMLVSVTERRGEIGLLKALGAKDRTVLTIFLLEAGSIGLVSALVGSLLGYGLLFLLEIITGIYTISGALLLLPLSVAFALVIAVGFGTYPAYKAARLDPAEVIRHE